MRRQSNDHFTVAFGVSLVVITFILILDIQSGLNLRGAFLAVPEPVPLYESTFDTPVNIATTPNPEERAIASEKKMAMDDTLAALRRKFGQHFARIGELREFMGSKSSDDDIVDFGQIFGSPKDRFGDLEEAVDYIATTDARPTEAKDILTLGQILSLEPDETTTILNKFNYEIKQNEMYAEHSETIDTLIQEMATRSIAHVEEKEDETQIKMTMQYDNGMLALAKPMRFPRDQQTLENHILYADYERHTADIAAFHLDRLLGFRRAFPVTGRIVNMTSEIYNICGSKLRNTFFTSLQPYNLCFYGNCRSYCDIYHPVCGRNGLIEASFVAFLPENIEALNYQIIHPWRESDNQYGKAFWERDPKYCEKIKIKPPYNKGRRLLDLIDMAIFDFLAGNRDRHHFEILRALGEDAFIVHSDNGKGFSRPFYDEFAILAPLVQCCMVRSSTLRTLLRFHNGPKPLSQLMTESMASDPVAPILWPPHLEALDRRVSIVLTALRHCIATCPIHDVVFGHDLP